jgi:hypothetical protein
MADVRVQVAFIVVAVLCSMLAVPFFYDHRMNDGLFTAGMLTFVGIPSIAGIVQTRAHRSIALTAISLLLLCPLVYLVTDPLAVEFERLRDGYFLATGSTLVFACAIWLASSLRSRSAPLVAIAALGLLSSAFAIFILLWMVMYFE